MEKLRKRLTQPSSYGGLGLLAIAVSQIVGSGGDRAEAIATGAEATGQAVAQGMPLWQSILIGVLGGAAVMQSDKSND